MYIRGLLFVLFIGQKTWKLYCYEDDCSTEETDMAGLDDFSAPEDDRITINTIANEIEMTAINPFSRILLVPS